MLGFTDNNSEATKTITSLDSIQTVLRERAASEHAHIINRSYLGG